MNARNSFFISAFARRGWSIGTDIVITEAAASEATEAATAAPVGVDFGG
jgi:hypothetical protein